MFKLLSCIKVRNLAARCSIYPQNHKNCFAQDDHCLFLEHYLSFIKKCLQFKSFLILWNLENVNNIFLFLKLNLCHLCHLELKKKKMKILICLHEHLGYQNNFLFKLNVRGMLMPDVK